MLRSRCDADALHALGWEHRRHDGALPRGADDRKRTTVQFHEMLGQGEAEAGARVLAAQAAVDLAEALERHGDFIRRHAYAGVRHRNRKSAVAPGNCTSTLPPAGVNFTALEIRFRRIWRTRRSSARRMGAPSGTSQWSRTSALAEWGTIRRRQEAIASLTSMASLPSSRWPASSLERSSTSSISSRRWLPLSKMFTA